MLRRRIGAALTAYLLLGSALGGAQTLGGQASDYDAKYGYSEHFGIVTPRDVFALANNFNAVLDYYLETHQKGRLADVGALTAEAVAGKQSDDVFVRSQRLAELVDRLATGRHLPEVLRIDREGETALPAETFLQVGASLDGLIFFLSALDASQTWGDFYVTLRYPDEKTPDDAFAVVDLAVRKLELVMSEPAADPAAAPEAPTDTTDPEAKPQPAAGA
jgi:hypothetical protein